MTATSATRRQVRQKVQYGAESRPTTLRLPVTLRERVEASGQAAGNGNVSAVIGYILAHYYGDDFQAERYLRALNGVAPR
jgi:hypothetical protein